MRSRRKEVRWVVERVVRREEASSGRAVESEVGGKVGFCRYGAGCPFLVGTRDADMPGSGGFKGGAA